MVDPGSRKASYGVLIGASKREKDGEAEQEMERRPQTQKTVMAFPWPPS